MKKVIVKNVEWTVTGNNEKPCVEDIVFNRRTELTEYVRTMFRQRYGCTAVVKNKED